jgi:hypothetical protein
MDGGMSVVGEVSMGRICMLLGSHTCSAGRINGMVTDKLLFSKEKRTLLFSKEKRTLLLSRRTVI